MGLGIDVIWNPYQILRRRGMGQGYVKYVKYVGFGIHIIIVFSSSLGTNGYLSVLEKMEEYDSQKVADSMIKSTMIQHMVPSTQHISEQRGEYGGCEKGRTRLGAEQETSRRPTPVGQ